MTRSRHAVLLAVLLAAACAPAAPDPGQSGPGRPATSLMMARLPSGHDAGLLSAMQARLLRDPLSGRVTQHGFAGEGLYTLEFVGSCAGNADLVAAVAETARAAGATETSCLPQPAFAPGEPVSFRRTPSVPAKAR